MNVAYKYKLLPTKEQEDWLLQTTGSARWLWNYMLALNQKKYKEEKKFAFSYDMNMLLPELKKQNPWLKETPSQALQQKCVDLDIALRRAFKKISGFPKFKAKHKSQDTLRIPQVISNGKDPHIKPSDTCIQIPKIGKIKWIQHRPLTGKLKSITISLDVDTWYVSCLVEVLDVSPKLIAKEKSIGIDLGIKDFAILSNGAKIKGPNLKLKELRVKKYQRKLAKKAKGSNNRNKARIKVAKSYRVVKNTRSDFLHKLSNEITTNYDLICLEDLKIKNLMMGKKQRSLNRAISSQGWGIFVSQLKYKAKIKGKTVTQINTYAPSSKTCSCCGHKVGKLGLEIREWICPSCGSVLDRDINAATNILVWGTMSTDYKLFKNTEGTSEINACGDLKTDMSNQCQGSLNQEATRSLVA